jgi:hypothetical protein
LNYGIPGRRPEKRPNTAHFGPEKQPPGTFLGGNFRPFWSTTGHFSCAANFVGLFGQLQDNFRRLGEIYSAHGNFLAPKQTKKTNEKKTISMHAIAYFNGNDNTSNSVFDIFCTVQVCLLDKTFSIDQFLGTILPL